MEIEGENLLCKLKVVLPEELIQNNFERYTICYISPNNYVCNNKNELSNLEFDNVISCQILYYEEKWERLTLLIMRFNALCRSAIFLNISMVIDTEIIIMSNGKKYAKYVHKSRRANRNKLVTLYIYTRSEIQRPFSQILPTIVFYVFL